MKPLHHALYATLLALLLPMAEASAAAAVVTHLSGTLSVLKANGTVKLLSQNSQVDAGDTLTTESGAYARLKFSDGGEVTLRPGTSLRIDSYEFDQQAPEKDSFVFSMLKGGLRTITGLVGKRGNQNAYRLNTATATIGIRGTNYGALLCNGNCGRLANGLYLDVVEGIINATNPAGQLDYSAGQYGYVPSTEQPPEILPQDPGLPDPDVTPPQQPGSTVVEGSANPQQPSAPGCALQ